MVIVLGLIVCEYLGIWNKSVDDFYDIKKNKDTK